MSEISEIVKPPLTEAQERFLGFVASHTHTKVGSSDEGTYSFTDQKQIFPMMGDVVFSQRREVDESGERLTVEVTYQDSREDRMPWLIVSFIMREDDNGQWAGFADDQADEAFLVELGGEGAYYEDDAFAVDMMDRFERLETSGSITLKTATA